MQKEIDFFGNAVNNPERPLVAILGERKFPVKLKVIDNFLIKCRYTYHRWRNVLYILKSTGGTKLENLFVEDE